MRYRGRQHHRHYQQSWLCWQMRSALQWKPDVQVLHFPWRGKSLEVLCIRREVVKNVETLNNLLEKERIQNSTCSLQAHLLPLLRLWDLYHRLWGLHHWEGRLWYLQIWEHAARWLLWYGFTHCFCANKKTQPFAVSTLVQRHLLVRILGLRLKTIATWTSTTTS